MTFQTVDAVIDAYRGPAVMKLVLIVVAKHDGDGGCWASVSTIAAETGLSERTVQRALADLHAAGVLGRDERRGRSTVYRVILDNLRTCDTPDTQSPHPRSSDTPPPSQSHPTPVTESPESVLESVPESVPEQDVRERAYAELDV